MSKFKRLICREEGVALVMALAFIALAVPMVTAALGLASTLSIDSRVKSDITKDQFSAIGTNEYAMDILTDDDNDDGTPDFLEEDDDGDGIPNVWEDEDGDGDPDGEDYVVDLNDEPSVVHVEPTDPSQVTPPDGEGLVVSKTVLPTALPANDTNIQTVTYTITVENTSTDPMPLIKIFDGLPPDFNYSGNTLLDGVPINDPDETWLWFDEADHSQGGYMMLTWDLYSLDIELQPSETITLSFEAEATDLEQGYYCNHAWTEPEGSQTRTGMTARIKVGSPANVKCVGEDIGVSGSVVVVPNPNDDPSDPNDDLLVTYSIVIKNDGPNDLNMWWIRDKLPPGFKYKWGTTTGDFTSRNPFAITLFGRQRLNWFFLFPTVPLDAGETKTLIFEATSPKQPGSYYNEVWVFFVQFDDDDAVYSWPSALVVMADVYEVTVDGEPTSQVWVIDGNSFTRRWYIGR